MMMAIKCMYIMYFQLQLIYKGLPFHLHTTEIHKGIDEAEQLPDYLLPLPGLTAEVRQMWMLESVSSTIDHPLHPTHHALVWLARLPPLNARMWRNSLAAVKLRWGGLASQTNHAFAHCDDRHVVLCRNTAVIGLKPKTEMVYLSLFWRTDLSQHHLDIIQLG